MPLVVVVVLISRGKMLNQPTNQETEATEKHRLFQASPLLTLVVGVEATLITHLQTLMGLLEVVVLVVVALAGIPP
jgi:hypothetical protein